MKLEEKHLELLGILLFAAWLFFITWAVYDVNKLELKLKHTPLTVEAIQ